MNESSGLRVAGRSGFGVGIGLGGTAGAGSGGGAGGGRGVRSVQEEFATVLARVPRDKGESRQEQARESARHLVAFTLVQPMLKQARESGMAAEPFAPTSGERAFRELADAQLSQRIVRAARFPLVESVAQHVLRLTDKANAQSVTPEKA